MTTKLRRAAKTVRYLILGLILLVTLSGCHQPAPQWNLSAVGQTVEEDGGVRFVGSVQLGGMADNTTVSGIRVEFRDANRTLLQTVQIGQLGDERSRVELNETFDQPPEFVLIKVESVDTPENYEWSISGLRRAEEGEYSPGYTDYDPIIGTPTADRSVQKRHSYSPLLNR